MSNFLWLYAGATFILLFGSIEILLLRQLNRDWWRWRPVRMLAVGLPLAGLVTVVLWGIGAYHAISWLSVSSSMVTALTLILELALMFSLPLSGLLHFLNRLMDRFSRYRREAYPSPPVNRQRRLFLTGAAAAVPAVTLASSVAGFTGAFTAVNVYRRLIVIDDLPQDLEGLRLLHLSDLHLGHYVTIENLHDVLQRARSLAPDIVLVTGDIADDLTQLAPALSLIAGLEAPLGTYAVLGNHEYFRGVERVRRIFDRSMVPLFVNEGIRLTVGTSTLFIGGIDDPQTMGGEYDEFFQRTLTTTLQAAQRHDVVILMSHRPTAFDYAAAKGVTLTLAGHTHGGQIGVFGRSVFEPCFADFYLWGYYRQGSAHLYTSSGVGHWFPFRLGCPPEAPVIELTSRFT